MSCPSSAVAAACSVAALLLGCLGLAAAYSPLASLRATLRESPSPSSAPGSGGAGAWPGGLSGPEFAGAVLGLLGLLALIIYMLPAGAKRARKPSARAVEAERNRLLDEEAAAEDEEEHPRRRYAGPQPLPSPRGGAVSPLAGAQAAAGGGAFALGPLQPAAGPAAAGGGMPALVPVAGLAAPPAWAAQAPANGTISLGNLNPALLARFCAADFKELLDNIDEHKLLARQGLSGAGAPGYAVLQQADEGAAEAPATLAGMQPKFDELLELCKSTAEDRLHVSRGKSLVRFAKLDGGGEGGAGGGAGGGAAGGGAAGGGAAGGGAAGGAPAVAGKHAVHTDVDVLDIIRVCISIYFVIVASWGGRGIIFLAGPSAAGPFTHTELTQGAISAQLGGVGAHGTEALPESVMRLTVILDVDVKENREPPPSVRAYVPAPTPFAHFAASPPVSVPAGTAARLAQLIAAAPQSRESAKAAWLAFVRHQLWLRLKLEERFGTISADNRAKLEAWRAGLAAGGEHLPAKQLHQQARAHQLLRPRPLSRPRKCVRFLGSSAPLPLLSIDVPML